MEVDKYNSNDTYKSYTNNHIKNMEIVVCLLVVLKYNAAGMRGHFSFPSG